MIPSNLRIAITEKAAFCSEIANGLSIRLPQDNFSKSIIVERQNHV